MRNTIEAVPIESDVLAINELSYKLGLSPEFAFMDIYSLDEAIIEQLPKPVLSVIALIPYSRLRYSITSTPSKDITWIPQQVSNTCGSIAILHCLFNCISESKLQPNSLAAKWRNYLQHESQSQPENLTEYYAELTEVQNEISTLGTTKYDQSNITMHYITFFNLQGHGTCLLDGRNDGPLCYARAVGEQGISISHIWSIIETSIEDKSANSCVLFALCPID